MLAAPSLHRLCGYIASPGRRPLRNPIKKGGQLTALFLLRHARRARMDSGCLQVARCLFAALRNNFEADALTFGQRTHAPLVSTALMCTNTSLSPDSGWMNP